MAPRKRAAEADPDEDEDSSSASSPPESSSQIGSEGRKRRRISGNSDTTPEHDNQNASQTTEDEEGLDEDQEYDSEDAMEFATQSLLQRKAREKPQGNVAREAGVLESVVLHDFMCHHYFEYTLGPLINFICGKNGSGKSAILTAIILCLGGKAAATNRGANLKRFIKEGTEKARIICKFRNRGQDAYMPVEFGNVITVERYFSKTSSAGYKIMTESGRIYSTKRSDLEAIVDHFGLQIDNPLNVLSQDMARSFIGSSNPAEKYKYFVKGVQLERLDQDYRLLDEKIQGMAPKLKLKAEDVESLKQAAKEKANRVELARRQDTINTQIRDLRRQLFWAQVKEQEDIVAEYDQEVNKADIQITNDRAHVEQLDVQYRQVEASLQDISAGKQETDTALANAKDEQRQYKNTYEESKAETNRARTEQRVVADRLKRASQAIQQQETLIEEEHRRLLEINGGGAAKRIQDLDTVKREAQQARDDFEAHSAGRAEIEGSIQQSRRRVAEKTAERDTRLSNVSQQREKLRDLQERGQRQTGAFRPNTDRLLQAIAAEKGWETAPVGPLGKHVRLLRPEWSSIIESMFGRTLSDFLVFSKRDSDLLNRLKRQTGCDAGVAIVNQAPIVPREPDDQFDTILRVLEIDNEYVTKYLIIQHAIEQHLLVPELRDANSAMYDSGRLRNVKGCFSFTPHDKSRGVLLKYTPSGEPFQDPVRGWAGQARMKSDLEATIAARRDLLEEAEKDLAAAETARTNARLELGKLDASLNRHKKRETELKVAVDAADDRVTDLEEAIKEDNVENGRLDALNQGLEEAKNDKVFNENQFKDAVTAADDKTRAMRQHLADLSEVDNKVAELQQKSSQAQEELRRVDSERAASLYARNNAEARVRDAEGDRERAVGRKERAAAELLAIIETARKETNSERVPINEGDTVPVMLTRHQKLKEQREQFRRQLGITFEEAQTDALKADAAHKQAKRDFDNLYEVRSLLKASLKQRRSRWLLFRCFITARAKTNFRYLLSGRGFRGELLMNHQRHLLDVSVEPDITRKNGQGRSAKTLSGGEKSFSQICLLLAIWDAIGSPIRCLDEFDVFMDAVNRNMSVRMIIEAARESVGRQFILISPGAKNDIVRAQDVTVQDLGAPERGGRGQQTIEEAGGVR